MSAYRYGQTVTLPARLSTEPGVTQTATVKFVDEIRGYVHVPHAGYIVTVGFEELDAAVRAQ